jgi:poly(3-hydroxybutyrate) depolymerase
MICSRSCRSMLMALAIVGLACSSEPSGTGGNVGAAGASEAGAPAQAGSAATVSGVAGQSGSGGGSAGQPSIAEAGRMEGGTGGTPSSASGASGALPSSAGGGNAGRGGAGGGAAGGAAAAGAGGTAGAVASGGCTKTPTLKNNGYNSITSGGKSRQYYLRWPAAYDKAHPYRLILGLHGATGKGTDVAPGFFGLYELSNGTTIFIAPDASGGLWSAATDTTFFDDILKAVEADLCIDTTRVELEGFSQGAAMAWTLACSRPKVFRAVVGHSGGGVANPTSCQPVPYLGSLGLSEGGGQKTQTDQFAKWNGCTIETLPSAPTGGHLCSDYKGCPAGYQVRWCPYDGGHTPSPNDAGKNISWMPSEVWPFLSQF